MVRSEQARFPERGAVFTRVQYKVGVPYNRFIIHPNSAVEAGLVKVDSRRLFLTHAGEEFIESYDKVLNLMGMTRSEDLKIPYGTIWT